MSPLKRAATPTTPLAPGQVVEVPDTIPRHGGDGRPKIWPAGVKPGAVGEKGDYYTRASSLGQCLEDGWAVHRAHARKIVYGFGRSQGLYDLAQAVTSLDEREALDTIADDAARMGGDGDAAMSGTALHLLSERADAGDPLDYLSDRLRKAVDAWRRLMERFTVHGTEQFVVHDELRAAGSYDRLVSPLGIMRAPDGTVITPNERLGLDLKSGKSADYFGPLYMVQQWVYFGDGAVPYSHAEGRGTWPDGIPPRSDWSLIPHVPLDHPEDAGFYWVDLDEGRRLAELALEVRKARAAKGLMPAELPDMSAPVVPVQVGRGAPVREVFAGQVGAAELPLTTGEVVGALRLAATPADLDALWEANQAVWSPYCTAVAKARLAELGAVTV